VKQLLVCVAVASVAGRASSLELGAEVGLVGLLESDVPLFDAGGYDTNADSFLGVIAAQQLSLSWLRLDVWLDVLTQIPIDVVGGAPAQYVPVDLGVRGGVGLGRWDPYVGVLGQFAVLTGKSSVDAVPLNPDFFGMGCDLGLDVAV